MADTTTTTDSTPTPPQPTQSNTKNKQSQQTDPLAVAPPNMHLVPLPLILNKFGTFQRLNGMLSMAQSELHTILGFPLSSYSQALNVSTPSLTMLTSALLNAGYLVSESHTAPNLVKTNAPNSFFIDFLKAIILLQNGCVGKDYDAMIKIPRALLAPKGMVIDENGNEIDSEADKKTTEDGKAVVVENSGKLETDKKTAFIADPVNQQWLDWVSNKDKVKHAHEALQHNPLYLKNRFMEACQKTHDAAQLAKQEAQAAAGKKVRDAKIMDLNQVSAWWALSRPLQHKINFTSQKRNKIGVFFGNPTAYWGPKAMAGSFNVRGYADLAGDKEKGEAATTTTTEAATGDNAKNISRALALAQQQRAMENQGRIRDKKKRNWKEGEVQQAKETTQDGEGDMKNE